MFFKRNECQTNYMKSRTIKDSDLPELDKITGDEWITVVKDYDNSKVNIRTIINSISKKIKSPIISINNKCSSKGIDFETALEYTPVYSRIPGAIITYNDIKKGWIIMQFTGESSSQWTMKELWRNIDGITETPSVPIDDRALYDYVDSKYDTLEEDLNTKIAKLSTDIEELTDCLQEHITAYNELLQSVNNLKDSVNAAYNNTMILRTDLDSYVEDTRSTHITMNSKINTNTSVSSTNTSNIVSQQILIDNCQRKIDTIEKQLKANGVIP